MNYQLLGQFSSCFEIFGIIKRVKKRGCQIRGTNDFPNGHINHQNGFPSNRDFFFSCQWNPSNNWRTWKDVRIPDKRSPNVVFLLFLNVNVSIAAVVECCIKFDIDFRALQTPVIWRKVQVDLGNMDCEFRQHLVACAEEKQQSIKYFWRHSLLGIQKMSPNCLRSPRSWMSPPLKCKCGWFTRQGANIFFSSVSRAPKGRTSKGWIWEGEDFSGRKTKAIFLTAK